MFTVINVCWRLAAAAALNGIICIYVHSFKKRIASNSRMF